jgi:hypothetical protein
MRASSEGGGYGGVCGKRHRVHNGRMSGIGATKFELCITLQLTPTPPDNDVRHI